jgi:thioredoxin 2
MSDTVIIRCAACSGHNRVEAARLDTARCGRCHEPLPNGHVLHVSDDELDALIAHSPLPVFVDFYADWCAPCRMVAPAVQALAAERAGRLVVAKVDTDQYPRGLQRLKSQSIPTLAVYRGGALAGMVQGAMRGPQLARWVDEQLA